MKILMALQLSDVSYRQSLGELREAALRIAGETAVEAALLLCGTSCGEAAAEAAKTGLLVYTVEDERFDLPHSDLFRQALVECIEENKPDLVLLRHEMSSLTGAAAAAMALRCRLITGVEEIFTGEEKTEFRRSVMGGALMISEEYRREPTVLTLQQGIFEAGKTVETSPREIIPLTLKGASSYTPLTLEEAESSKDLDAAEVIVAAGNGIGEEENLQLINELAEIFSSAAVGGSRIVCDRGWLPYSRQIGITGKTVAPRLYLACGISGTSQHVAGMKKSRTIIAINRDHRAPVFHHADYGVAEDLTSFIPVLLEAYRQGKGRKQ